MKRLAMLVRVLAIIAVVEVLVMLILRALGFPEGFRKDLVDAGLLASISAPALYFWVVRRMGSVLANERMQGFMDTVPDLIQSVNPEGRFLYVNHTWLETLGYARHEVSRLSMFDIIHPDHHRQCKSMFERILSGELVENIETVFVAKDGRSIPVAGNINCQFKDGKPDATRGIFRNITERKRAEAAVRESEGKVRLLLDSTAEGIYGIDLDGNCTLANAACLRILGYENGRELVGKNTHELMHYAHMDGTPYPQAECRIYEAFRRGEGTHVDDEVLWRADGTSFPVEYWSYPVRNDGKLAGAVVTFLDISERKRAEEARLDSERRYLDLFENAHDAIFTTDVSGRITSTNRAAEQLTGYTREEIVGMPVLHLLGPELVDLARQEIARLATGGEPATREWEIITKGGQRVPLEVSTRTIYEGDKPVGIQAIARDISERKHAERKLQQAKEAAEATSRAKSEFLANMSHEIRTPMNGIIGMTDLALDTPLSPEQREYLLMVKDSADSLLSLINDILDLSRIEAGKLGLDPQEFDLQDTLGNAMRSLAVRADQKGLELALRTDPRTPLRVIGDAGRLRQVLLNLVGNAVKFTERGEVVVSVDAESQEKQAVLLRFTVRDTGIGIAPEKQQMVFGAFTQADSSLTRKYGGTGLGLSISARLVQMMGGKIWLESAPGEGSTFHFTARLALPQSPAAEATPREVVSLRDMPVLVVDDNATNRKILEAMLTHWLMLPTLAESGPGGLATLEQAASEGKPFPLVLLDAQMPELDGFALAEKIKQNPRLAGATIMMLTSAGQRGDAARCRELGITAYLIKPIRQSELLEAILMALRKTMERRERAAVITRHTLRENRRKLQILLAEDNVVNQQLAVRLLEKRGHVVAVASNGSEAVALLKKSRFDLVLMDVQMPEMDGFQATAAIRKEEEATGKHVPIIAITAHAMEGDRERCLAAGMDGYVAKPIKVECLAEAIESFARSPEVAKVATTAKPREQEPIDSASALARVEGDVDLLRDLVALFLKGLPELLRNLREAVTAGDTSAIERAAHKLKGSVGNFAAQPAFEAALKLEVLGRDGSLSEAEPAYSELENEINRLKSAMANLSELKVRP